jgi:hypothetical protein
MDRMFHVIVLGGVALVGGACGARTSLRVEDGAGGEGGATTAPTGTTIATVTTGFPSESGQPNSGGFTTVSAESSSTGFPHEANVPRTASVADSSSTGFPQEI